jgi:hypothetical protein
MGNAKAKLKLALELLLGASLVLALLASCSSKDSPIEEGPGRVVKAPAPTGVPVAPDHPHAKAHGPGPEARLPTSDKDDTVSPTREVGETAELGSVKVTLNSVREHSFDDYRHGGKTYQGRFYSVVDVTIHNTGQKGIPTYDAPLFLSDGEGNSFEVQPISDQEPYPSGGMFPGRKNSGELAYDLGTKPEEGPLFFSATHGEAHATWEFSLDWQQPSAS